MTEKRFRVNELVKYNYSEIGEYIDENHTDSPLRNDEVVELLNELNKEKRKLKNELNLSKLNLKEKNEGFDKIHKMYMEQIEKNNELAEENEQCKMMIATLRNIILENGIDVE